MTPKSSAERASAAQVLASGNDPESEDSRAWQMCEVTRTLRNGQTGPLPEGAAGWLVRSWGPERIATGWWRTQDVERDYYRAEWEDGTEVWIYLDPRNSRWFLHGFFD